MRFPTPKHHLDLDKALEAAIPMQMQAWITKHKRMKSFKITSAALTMGTTRAQHERKPNPTQTAAHHVSTLSISDLSTFLLSFVIVVIMYLL